jgi:hypothetical protein
MATKIIPKEPESVACKVCLEEIPQSVSKSHEANEYAQHFCGIECYTLWKKEQEQADRDSE